MSKKFFILAFLLQIALSANGQFQEKTITTDSSKIEITKNSVYKIYEEKYFHSDSVWYSVKFIDDTSQIHTEGWKNKEGEKLGVWKQYNKEGTLMFTWNHDTAVCIVNESLYPWHNLLKKMKKQTDHLIISTYSNEFFEKHVQFDYNCYAYDKNGYVGSWIEPMERRPTKFLFRYSVRVDSSSNWRHEMIGIKLDSTGTYLPSHDQFNNYGFEDITANQKTFNINAQQALEVAKNEGLNDSKYNTVSSFLTWEQTNGNQFYTGRFRYYVTNLIEKHQTNLTNGRSRIRFVYNVYSFDPWTGKYIEKKKMQRISESGDHSGFSTELQPVN